MNKQIKSINFNEHETLHSDKNNNNCQSVCKEINTEMVVNIGAGGGQSDGFQFPAYK